MLNEYLSYLQEIKFHSKEMEEEWSKGLFKEYWPHIQKVIKKQFESHIKKLIKDEPENKDNFLRDLKQEPLIDDANIYRAERDLSSSKMKRGPVLHFTCVWSITTTRGKADYTVDFYFPIKLKLGKHHIDESGY